MRLGFGSNQEDGGNTISQDLAFGFAGMILLVFIVVVTLISVEQVEENTDENVNQERLVVRAVWDPTRDADVDLHVRAPNDRHVYYGNKSGRVFDLIRDDLGHRNEFTKFKTNEEMAETRGLVAGEYLVNVHYYSDHDRGGPVEVEVVITVQKEPKKRAKPLFEPILVKLSVTQEKTVVRFELTEEGDLVPGSRNNVQENLFMRRGR